MANPLLKAEILKLHGQGVIMQRIADTLGCSRNTVRYHIDPTEQQRIKSAVGKKREWEKAGRPPLPPVFIKEKVVKPVKVKEPPKPVGRPRIGTELVRGAKKKTSTPVYETRQLNLDQTVRVNLGDAKNTVVHAAPGYDINELRKKFKIKVA